MFKKYFIVLISLYTIFGYTIGHADGTATAPTTKAATTETKSKDNGCTPTIGHYCVHIDTFKEGGEDIKGSTGVELLTNYIGVIYKIAASIIGLICVLVIVISSLQITAGGMAPEGVNQAKDRILQAIFSMVLLFSSALILRTINSNFFTDQAIEEPATEEEATTEAHPAK